MRKANAKLANEMRERSADLQKQGKNSLRDLIHRRRNRLDFVVIKSIKLKGKPAPKP